MSVVDELQVITSEFYSFLCDESIKRSDKVEKVQEFLLKTQPLMETLPKDRSETKPQIEAIIMTLPKIQTKMIEIQADIKRDITRVQNTKRFANPQPIISKEGTFFDTKQ